MCFSGEPNEDCCSKNRRFKYLSFFVRSGDPSLTRKPKGKEGHNIERGGAFSIHPSLQTNLGHHVFMLILLDVHDCKTKPCWLTTTGRPSSDWTHTGFLAPASYFSSGAPFFLDFHILCLFALARAARPDHVPKPNNGSLHLPHGL